LDRRCGSARWRSRISEIAVRSSLFKSGCSNRPAKHVAQDALPHVAMSIDHARHHDHAGGVDVSAFDAAMFGRTAEIVLSAVADCWARAVPEDVTIAPATEATATAPPVPVHRD